MFRKPVLRGFLCSFTDLDLYPQQSSGLLYEMLLFFSVWQVDRLDVGANVTTQNGCYTAFHAGSSRLIVNYDPEILSHVPDLGSKYVNIISLLAGHWMPLVCFSKTGKVTAPAPRRPLSSYQTLPMSPQDGGGRNLEGRKPPMIFYDTPLSLRMFSVW